MEVALEPSPLGVAGLDDPGSRGAHLGELGAQLGLQPRVLEREARGGADRLEELRLVQERRDRGRAPRAPPVVLEDGDRTAFAERYVERVPARIDVAFVCGQPEGELERRIAERARDRVADVAGRESRPELHDQIGYTGTCSRVRRSPTRKATGTAANASPLAGPRIVSSMSPPVASTMPPRRIVRTAIALRQEHGVDCAAGRRTRPAYLSDEQHDGERQRAEDEQVHRRLKDTRNGVGVHDEKRVRGTARAGVRLRTAVPKELRERKKDEPGAIDEGDEPSLEACREPTARECKEEVNEDRNLQAGQRREEDVRDRRVPVQLAREIGEPGCHHEQPDAVSRTSLPGNEPSRDPDPVQHDLAKGLRRPPMRLEVVSEEHEQRRGDRGRDPHQTEDEEEAAAHPEVPARLASAAAERSSLWMKPRAGLRSSRAPKSVASRLDVRTTRVAAPLSAIRSATSNPSVSGKRTSSSTT